LKEDLQTRFAPELAAALVIPREGVESDMRHVKNADHFPPS